MLFLGFLLTGCVGSSPFAMGFRAKRAEVPKNLASIHTAETAYMAAFDDYVGVPEPVPRAVDALTKGQVPWVQGTAFDTLGWAPDGQVRGAYWVELGDDGKSFTAHGIIDIDGDGEPSHGVIEGDGAFRWLVEDDW